jgi:predicted phosphodiesterase
MIYPGVNSQMEILWQDTATEATNTLTWDTDPSFGTNPQTVTVPEYGSYNQHMYTITGLQPDTKYYYQVADATNGVYGTGSFITAPVSNSTHVRFLGMGDSRTNPTALDSVMQAMKTFYQQTGNSEYQRLVIHNGDWVSSDSDILWTQQWFGPIALNGNPSVALTDRINFTANSPINGCKGNHDNNSSYPTGNSIYFPKYFPFPYQNTTVNGVPTPFNPANVQAYGNLYYSYDYGPVHITVVDNYSNLADGSAQNTWVKNDLALANANPNTPWKILIYHEPAYSAGSDGDNSNVRVLEKYVTQYGVDLIYCGHSHNYARTGAYTLAQANGDTIALNVPHITSGGGGAPVYQPDMTNAKGYPHVITAWPAFEFMTFDVNGKDLTMTAYQVNNVSTSAMPSNLSITPIETVKLHHYTNVASQVTATVSGFTYSRATKLYSGNLIITNNGPTALAGNVDVVLDGLVDLNMIGAANNQYSTNSPKQTSKIATKPATGPGSTDPGLMTTVTLVNATGSNNGEPMIQATTSGLAVGASVTVPLTLSNPSSLPLNFNPITYQE